MNFQKDDILTKKERDGRLVVWLRESWVTEHIPGLTDLNLRVRYRPMFAKSVGGEKRKKQNRLPDTGYKWRYARFFGTYYYDYDRLPESKKGFIPGKEELIERYESTLGDTGMSELEQDITAYCKDVSSKWLKAYDDCTSEQARNLARACAVIQFAAMDIAAIEPGWSNEYYRNIAKIIEKHSWAYLPKNYRRLKEKIDQVAAGANVTDVIKLPRKGNNNRKTYNDPQVIAWIMYLRSRPENYSNAHIARRVMKMCAIATKDAPSLSWIEHYLATTTSKYLTGGARHRSGRKGADYRDYVPVAGALYAGDCWQMDATRVNFLPHKADDGREKSLVIIACRDVHSGDFVGYHFDTKEDRYGYIHCLNMAVATTGHLPYELVHDRFPGHNTPEWETIRAKIKREGTKVTVTSTATGKSAVERCFSTLQDVFMQDFAQYYGQGIMSSRVAAHRSPEYLLRAKREANRAGWDFEAAWRAGCAVVEAYRSTPLCEYSRKYSQVSECPKELYQQSEQVNVRKVDEWTRVELFCTMREETIRNNGLIRMRIHKAEYVYRIDQYDIISNYKKVNIAYDLEDLSKIHLFAPRGEINSLYLGEALSEKAVHLYGPQADYERLAKMKAARKKVQERRKAELEEITMGAAEEVAILLPAVSTKVAVNTSETRWLEDRLNTWQDKGNKRRMEIPPPPADDNIDFDLVIRNY